MPTTAELRPRFEYDVEYVSGHGGLYEFDPEVPRGGLMTFEASRPVDIRLGAWAARRVPSRRWPWLVPLGMVAIASSALVALAQREPRLPPVSAAPAAWSGRGALAARPVPDVPPAKASPIPVAPQAAPAAGDESRLAVDQALAGVEEAYRTLDAASMTRVWPGADTVSLAAQFAAMKYQSLSFERCDVSRVGSTQAVAICDAVIGAVPQSGDLSPKRRRERWSMVLNREGDRYLIGSVLAR